MRSRLGVVILAGQYSNKPLPCRAPFWPVADQSGRHEPRMFGQTQRPTSEGCLFTRRRAIDLKSSKQFTHAGLVGQPLHNEVRRNRRPVPSALNPLGERQDRIGLDEIVQALSYSLHSVTNPLSKIFPLRRLQSARSPTDVPYTPQYFVEGQRLRRCPLDIEPQLIPIVFSLGGRLDVGRIHRNKPQEKVRIHLARRRTPGCKS